MVLGRSLLTVLLAATSVLGGLYGTHPIADTVLSAGRSVKITWINDKFHPSLDEMGPISIELYHGEDNHVTTLAKDVDPRSRSERVWISPSWGPNDSTYHMRFICEDPQLTVYTADFAITDMAGDAFLDPPQGTAAAKLASANQTTIPVFSITPPTASPVSDRTTGFSSSSAASPSSIIGVSSGDTNEDPFVNKKTGSSGGSLWRRTTVDLERVKFRMVFILWPVLVGFSMAL
ncbi:hypothetical protein B0H21DRAFT_433026 [Amylocystis lapponica]|nr:hypothetical protein B0H21DRAFT_433026 [Amylocystis lapponica]